MRGMPGWQPSRLRDSRVARGFSQAGLAAHVDRSPATASKWEKEGPDGQSPDEATFIRLALILKVRPSFLLKQPRTHDNSAFFPRELASNLKSVAETEKIKLRWLQEIGLAVQDYVDLPAVAVPDLLKGQGFLELRDDDIEIAATTLRRHWNIQDGPISDVILAMENAGIVVGYDVVHSAKMDGLSNWCAVDSRPYVLLAEDKYTAVRSRMDAAHELAHVALHRGIDDATQRKHHNLIEAQAWRFAAAFLLPAESFLSDVNSITLNGFLGLKDRWKVSVSAMIMRCADLGIIDPSHKSALFKNLSIRGWRKQEPLDNELGVEMPRMLRRAIELIVRENVCSARDLVDNKIGLSPEDIVQLTKLQPDFFLREVDESLGVRLKAAAEPEGMIVEFPRNDARGQARTSGASAEVHSFPRKRD